MLIQGIAFQAVNERLLQLQPDVVKNGDDRHGLQ